MSRINKRRANLENGRAAEAVQDAEWVRREARSVERGCCNDRSEGRVMSEFIGKELS